MKNPPKRVPDEVIAGRGTYFGGRPKLLYDAYGSKVRIGNYTSIAAGVTFFLGGHHNTKYVTMYPFRRMGTSYSKGDIVVGNDCWIGHGATILDGVVIGDGAVVGAESVVARDVPPYAVVAGNPARLIRYRFTQDVVKRLLKIRWWDWREDQIANALVLLRSEDPWPFLRKYGV